MSLKRADGRFGVSLRALACETSHLERADGSAQFQHGQTLVMASVTGPVEAKPKQECADRAVVQVFVKTFDAAPSDADSEMAMAIRATLEPILWLSMHPRTSIDITVHIVDDDGSALAASINAAVLALIDAGVACKTMLAAVQISIGANGELLLDPTQEEQKNELVGLSFAFSGADEGAVMAMSSGVLSESAYLDCLDTARKACTRIRAFAELAIRNQ